jgi:hypothetical protein
LSEPGDGLRIGSRDLDGRGGVDRNRHVQRADGINVGNA